jgi:hypothetical protein
MGANAQTEVPAFTSGQVLTAAEVTQINTGIPVFATTVTRDAAFGGAGEKVLAQGQYAYIEATSTLQVYTGSAWVSTSSGLNLVVAQTIGSAVASVTVSNAFSATYDAYKIVISGGVGSADDRIEFRLGASVTGYYASTNTIVYSTNVSSNDTNNNTSSWQRAGRTNASGLSLNVDITNPFLATRTLIFGQYISFNTAQGAGANSGFHNVATSYTDFTLTPASGTLTGGTIRVYGYENS